MFGIRLFCNTTPAKLVTNDDYFEKYSPRIVEQIERLGEKYLLNKPVKRKTKFRPKVIKFNKFIANKY